MNDEFRFMNEKSRTAYDLLKYLYKNDEKELVHLVLDMLKRLSYQDGIIDRMSPEDKL